MTCETCGEALHVGDWPFCAGPGSHTRSKPMIVKDDVPGGFTVENAWREPRTFYSQSEYERALKADGMELCPRWVPGSKHLTNWATVDPQTLENGRILAERQAHTRARAERSVTCETLTLTTRVLEQGFTVKADA